MKKLCITLCVFVGFAEAQVYKRIAPTIQKPKEKEPITIQSKTGFMLGLENAYTLHSAGTFNQMNISVGALMGYNVYFTKKHGLRMTGNYSYFLTNLAHGNEITNYQDTQRFGFGLDYLFDYFNSDELGLSLGLFVGIGAGYDLQSYFIEGKSTQRFERYGFYAYGTIGLNIIFQSHNRIDIGYRYTFINSNYFNQINNQTGTVASPFSLAIGYSYIF